MNKRRFVTSLAVAHLTLTLAVGGIYSALTDHCFGGGIPTTAGEHALKALESALLMPIAYPTIRIADSTRSNIVVTEDPLATPLAILCLFSIVLNSIAIGFSGWTVKNYFDGKGRRSAA